MGTTDIRRLIQVILMVVDVLAPKIRQDINNNRDDTTVNVMRAKISVDIKATISWELINHFYERIEKLLCMLEIFLWKIGFSLIHLCMYLGGNLGNTFRLTLLK